MSEKMSIEENAILYCRIIHDFYKISRLRDELYEIEDRMGFNLNFIFDNLYARSSPKELLEMVSQFPLKKQKGFDQDDLDLLKERIEDYAAYKEQAEAS